MFSRRFRPTLILIAVIISLSACSGTKGSPDSSPTPAPTDTPNVPTATPVPIAATVNGDGITVAEFQAELIRYKESQTTLGKLFTEEQANQAVLDDLIAQTLLARGALDAGFVVDDAMLDARIQALAEQVGGTDLLVKWETEHGYNPESFRETFRRQIAAAWMRDRLAAQVPISMHQVHIQQILLYNEDAARKAADRLAAGADFDQLAATYDPSTRGDLGWFPRGYLLSQAIEDAAFTLQPGQTSEIITTDIGYHIIHVIADDPNRPLAPDALLALQAKAVWDWVSQQRQQSVIVLVP